VIVDFFSGCGHTQELQLTSYNIAPPLQLSKICARVIFTGIANTRFSKNHILRIHKLRDLGYIWVMFSPNIPSVTMLSAIQRIVLRMVVFSKILKRWH
jgi:hypothetical protein